jgi:hypothetical protein
MVPNSTHLKDGQNEKFTKTTASGMGLLASCCPKSSGRPASHFAREETITVPDSKKTSVFANVDVSHDATPLLKTTDGKVVVVSDSGSDSFDQTMIDRLLEEQAHSHGSA